MLRRHALLLAPALLFLSVLAGCSGAQSGSSGSGGSGAPSVDQATAALISERCTACHSVDRIKEAKHDAPEWADSVTRMRGKGARLSDDQAQQIVDFLAAGGAAKL